MFTAMQDTIDCSKLMDNKWHNIILRKQLNKIEFLIDDQSIGKIPSNASLSRVLNIGTLPFTMNQSIY
jgi:hypothetical protein